MPPRQPSVLLVALLLSGAACRGRPSADRGGLPAGWERDTVASVNGVTIDRSELEVALVGRAHELALLLERWAWAKDGDGQVVLISGEPGIGKSRLIRTLRERLGDEPYTPLSHYCSPYHVNSALYPVIGLLERAARLDRDDPPEAQLAKLEAVLSRSSDRLEEVVPLLAAAPCTSLWPS